MTAKTKKTDRIDSLLKGADGKVIKKVLRENGWSARWKKWEETGAGPGSRRMALGNLLRGSLRRGIPVKVLGTTIRRSAKS